MKLTPIEIALLDERLPIIDTYTQGYRDCFESVLLALRGVGITVTGVLVDTVLDAYANNEARPLIVDPEEVAMAAAFMWQGAFALWDKMQESEAPGDSGQTSWVNAVTRHAERCEKRWLKHMEEDGSGIDGVWSYDVCEPYGLAIASFMLKEGHSPTDEEADGMLEWIVNQFFFHEPDGAQNDVAVTAATPAS